MREIRARKRISATLMTRPSARRAGSFRGSDMREFAVAIALSVFVVGGVLLLPYSVNTTPLPATIAVRETASAVEKRLEAPAPRPAHGHLQMAQAVATGGDAEQGRQVYRKCQACHSLEAGKNTLGPSLAGIIGKKAASVPDYAYSEALRASGLTWDIPTLDRYLLDPQTTVPGNKMPFPGLKTANERSDVIAYLAAAAAPVATPPTPAPAPPQPSVSYIPDVRYTLRSGIAEGRMVF